MLGLLKQLQLVKEIYIRVLLMMAYTGRLFQASGNSDIKGLLVEVHEKVGIPVIAVCERAQKG